MSDRPDLNNSEKREITYITHLQNQMFKKLRQKPINAWRDSSMYRYMQKHIKKKEADTEEGADTPGLEEGADTPGLGREDPKDMILTIWRDKTSCWSKTSKLHYIMRRYWPWTAASEYIDKQFHEIYGQNGGQRMISQHLTKTAYASCVLITSLPEFSTISYNWVRSHSGHNTIDRCPSKHCKIKQPASHRPQNGLKNKITIIYNRHSPGRWPCANSQSKEL